MSGKIADVYAEVTWKFDQTKLRDVAKYIGDLNLASVISATSLTGLGLEIKNIIDQTGQLAIGLATIHSTTGIDQTFLQKFENASFELNSTKESADSLITSFSKMKAQLNLPGGQVPVGLRMMGFTKQDFEGTLEDNMKMVWTRLSKSKPPANASNAIKEQWQGLLSNLASTFNVTPEQFMAMSNPAFENKFNASPYLNKDELAKNIDAVMAWKEATVDLNTDLQRLVTTITPALTKLTEATDFLAKKTSSTLNVTPEQNRLTEKKVQDFLMGGFLKDINLKGLFEPIKLKKDVPADMKVTINMAPITIAAKDISEFEKKFEDYWKKMMVKAANEFGLGTT